MARVLDEEEQQIEGLGFDRESLGAAEQPASRQIHPNLAEVNGLRVRSLALRLCLRSTE